MINPLAAVKAVADGTMTVERCAELIGLSLGEANKVVEAYMAAPEKNFACFEVNR